MKYKLENKYAEVSITPKDVDGNMTKENIYSYMPEEVQEFYYKNKDKSNFKETLISGIMRPYFENDQQVLTTSFNGVTFIFELL